MAKPNSIDDPSSANFEIGIDPGKVAAIIDKARMFDVKEEMTDPDSGSNATDDDMRDILEESASDATYQDLRETIRNLDLDEQVALVALAWIGRGTYTPKEWREAVDEARGAHNSHTAEYLTGLPLLGDYLEEGLNAIEEAASGETVNMRRTGAKATARK